MDDKKIDKVYDNMLKGKLPSDKEVKELEKNILNDDQVDELLDKVSGIQSKDDIKLRTLPSNADSAVILPPADYQKSLDESKEQLSGEQQSIAVVNNATGMVDYVQSHEIIDSIDTTVSLEDVLSEVDQTTFSEENVKGFTNDAGLSDESAMCIFTLMNDIEKGEKNIYEKMTDELKETVKNLIPVEQRTKKNLDISAFQLVNFFKNQLIQDKAFIDLQEGLQQTLGEADKDLGEHYLEFIRENMEVDLLEKAEKINDEKPELAERFRKLSAIFSETYTYERLIKKIENKGNIIRKELNKDLKNYYDIVKKFNSKYSRSKFVITNPDLMIMAIYRALDQKYNIVDIQKFVILFCNVCKTYDRDDVFDHSYMYYTIKNIVSLDTISSVKSEFTQTIIDNLDRVLSMIK